VEVTEEISKLNQSINAISKLFSELNENKSIIDAFDKLNIG
jgi:hypothetical protein